MFLQQGFVIKDKYEITKKIAVEGSTVLYFAKNREDSKMVLLKEFFPISIMKRNADMSLTAISGSEVQYKSLSSDYFELCNYVISIKEIGGVLAPFDVFLENGTCYSAEALDDSETLEDYLARNDGHLTWQQLKKAILPIISAIRKMHSDGCYHRGISPANIIVNKKGEMLLQGFDIPPARTLDSEIAATLYFGYSAPEQYSSASWQGSWTDVYSLAAVCYRALTGSTPVEWRQRAKNRSLIPPCSLDSTIPENVSNSLLTALSVDIRNRYRTCEEFWIGLLHGAGDTTIIVTPAKMKGMVKTINAVKEETNSQLEKSNKWGLLLFVSFAMILVTILSCIMITLLIKQGKAFTIKESENSSEFSQTSEESEKSNHDEEEAAAIKVPAFINMSVEAVMQDKAYTSDFNFEIQRAFSELHPVGTISGQYPPPDTEFKEKGHTVVLTLSMGSERDTMPLVEGMPLDQAAALLNSLNIQYEISEISDIEYRDGTVIKSSIPFGETIYKTRVIVLLTVARNTPEAPSSSSSSVPKYALDTPKSTEPKYGFVDNPELNPPNN